MKQTSFLRISITVLLLILTAACGKKDSPHESVQPAGTTARFHIGIITGTSAQSEDDLRGAEKLIELYGSVETGGMIQHITFSNDFTVQQEVLISQLVSLANDPAMKAIIVNQAVQGTAEAFRRIKEVRPDIILLAGEPHEDISVIQSAADVVVSTDFVSRGYTIIWAAKELGAKTFVHISFPRHMSYETLGCRRQIMEAACSDFGMKFVFEAAPDPTGELGLAGAQQFILENVPLWIEKYGKETVFFCTNDAHTELLLKELIRLGGLFVEADLPSPLMGYPGALGIAIPAGTVNVDAIFDKVEQAVVDKGGAGRFGSWAFSYGYTVSAALGEYARRIIEGSAQKESIADLSKTFGVFTPGARWRMRYYSDPVSGSRIKNHVLVFMDTYIFGKGFLPTTDQEIMQKYLDIAFDAHK